MLINWDNFDRCNITKKQWNNIPKYLLYEQSVNFKKKKVAWFFCHPLQDAARQFVHIFSLPSSLTSPPPIFPLG